MTTGLRNHRRVSSRSDAWITPRQSLDPHRRRLAFGKVQPMSYPKPSLLERLWARWGEGL